MTSTPSLRRAVLVLLGLTALFATAGCVNLPANTQVSVVGNPAKAGSGADVRIWPQGPRPDPRHPEQVVEGFLQTAASDPSNFSIARAYLTGAAHDHWLPDRVVVFSEVSSPALVPGSGTPGDPSVQIQISGTEVATVSDNGTYQQVLEPTKENYTFDLSLNQAKGYYQIDRLPNDEFGILLTQEDFRANYAAYYLYYLNQDAPTTSMIPVPDYQRSQTGDAVTAQNLVGALLGSPPDDLAGVAARAAPHVDLVPSQLTIGQDGTASVPVKTPSDCTQDRSDCKLLADELLATFSSLASVSMVTLVDAQGDPLVSSSAVDTLPSQYHYAATPDRGTAFYYLDSKTHQVNSYDSLNAGSNPTSVEQIGPNNRRYSLLAVGYYDQQTYAAAVDEKGTKLYVALPGTSKDSAPVFTGHRIGSPTWDALGHLWFIDFVGTTANLYRLDFTTGPTPTLQSVDVLDTGGDAITGIAAAPDGRRIAVSLTVPGSAPGAAVDSVGIAMAVEDAGSSLVLNLDNGTGVDQQQPVVYHWTSLLGVWWHGSQSLAVLGSASASSPLTVSQLNSDGSPVINAADLNPVTFVPPTATDSIAWTGVALLAGTQSGSGAAAVQQVEQYSFTTQTWTIVAYGSSPTYMNYRHT